MSHNHGYIPLFFELPTQMMMVDINHASLIVQNNMDNIQMDLPQL